MCVQLLCSQLDCQKTFNFEIQFDYRITAHERFFLREERETKVYDITHTNLSSLYTYSYIKHYIQLH